MRRTAGALVLTLTAIAIPCGAWYVVGSRGADAEAERIIAGPRRELRDAALRLAERIAIRLERLADSESVRPFYHYQSLYHDPRGAHEGASITPSPLAAAAGDPLVRAHFQIDASGRLTLPTLNEEVCDLNAPETVASQQPILRELEAAARGWWKQIEARPGTSLASFVGRSGSRDVALAPGRVEMMPTSAWVQNLLASQLYVDLRSGRQQPPLPTGDEVVIQTGPFVWSTVTIGDEPSLVALREVTTPAGILSQGFQVSPDALRQMVVEAAPGAALELRPGAGPDAGAIGIPIAGAPWHLRVYGERGARLAEAERHAAAIVHEFRRGFAAGMTLALLAGLMLVTLVFQAERLAEVRGRFAASAAHELRTPLAGLRMYGEMLADGLGDPARGEAYARRIADEAERLSRVVSNVLGFSRLERGTLRLDPGLGNLATTVAATVERLRPAVEASGAVLIATIPSSLPTIRFDDDATQQILENLVDNAEKHTRGTPDRRIEVRLEVGVSSVELSVTDNGPGVPPRTRLFRPFARSKSPDAPAGLGLGLVMVKALADAQGARVSHAGGATGGAVFTVSFPVLQSVGGLAHATGRAATQP